MIKSLLNKLLGGVKNSRLLKEYAIISPSVINTGIVIRLDAPEPNRKYLKVGDDSIVSGAFIFESKEGLVEIGNESYIGGGHFISRSSIIIGDHVTIAWGGMFYDHNSHSLDPIDRCNDLKIIRENLRSGVPQNQRKNWNMVETKPIKICNNVWIGMNVTVLKGVTIGEGAVVAACSVVVKDVPAWTVVAGNPAVVVKKLKDT